MWFSAKIVLGVFCGFDSEDNKDFRKERQALRKALSASDVWYLDVMINPSPAEFLSYLRACTPTVAHFCGHGRKNKNSIVMNAAENRQEKERLSTDALSEALMDTKQDKLELAVLNCYFSADDWDRVAEAGQVIGMTGSFSRISAGNMPRSFIPRLWKAEE